jgi:CRP-like cAMP-binding protein
MALQRRMPVNQPLNTPSDSPPLNWLLAALPQAEWQRCWPHVEHVKLPFGQVLCEPGVTQGHAYFPTSAIVSLLHVVDSGASAEMAVVGNDGLVGAALLLSGGSTNSRAEVQVAGHGYRIRAQALKDVFQRSLPMRQLLLRHMQALMTQMAQAAVCTRHHVLEQRLCRLLLLRLDRLRGSDIVMTHALLANALGVRRESVTTAVLELQAASLIRCARGRISVLNRAGLERASCGCYAAVKKETDRLVPPPLAASPRWPKAPAGNAVGAFVREDATACLAHV